MFVLLSRYVKPLEEVDRVVAEHRAYLAQLYDAGYLLVSGPQQPRTGGVIVTGDITRERVDEIVANDPFTKAGISRYEIVEFNPAQRRYSVP